MGVFILLCITIDCGIGNRYNLLVNEKTLNNTKKKWSICQSQGGVNNNPCDLAQQYLSKKNTCNFAEYLSSKILKCYEDNL